jgi:hypothetical protein
MPEIVTEKDFILEKLNKKILEKQKPKEEKLIEEDNLYKEIEKFEKLLEKLEKLENEKNKE